MRSMGRVYDTIISKGKALYTLFDIETVHNYIRRSASDELNVIKLATL